MKSVFSEQSAARNARVGEAVRSARAAPVLEAGWTGSSFDLAQGLEVREMESKLSPETLEELFRSS